MKITYLLLTSTLILTLYACAGIKPTTTPPAERPLAELMTGSFSSSKQAQSDSTYYDITLHMYPIWTAQEGDWLKMEIAGVF